MLRSAFVALFSAAVCDAHPSQHPEFAALAAGACDRQDAPILSWHIHVLYQPDWAPSRDHAKQLYEHAPAALNATAICEHGLFANPSTCLFEGMEDDHAGPFVTGQWSLFIPASQEERLGPMLRYFSQRRTFVDELGAEREVSVLLHTNTGCEVRDHSTWASWNGPAYPLKLGIFSCASPGCGGQPPEVAEVAAVV